MPNVCDTHTHTPCLTPESPPKTQLSCCFRYRKTHRIYGGGAQIGKGFRVLVAGVGKQTSGNRYLH